MLVRDWLIEAHTFKVFINIKIRKKQNNNFNQFLIANNMYIIYI